MKEAVAINMVMDTNYIATKLRYANRLFSAFVPRVFTTVLHYWKVVNIHANLPISLGGTKIMICLYRVGQYQEIR